MRVVVLVKQVPDTTNVKVDPKTGNLIRKGVESIVNPDDRHAIELAVQLKEDHGAETVVLSMGPPQALDVITEAMAMGIDEGTLLSDVNFSGADTWATSFTLKKGIEKLGSFDLVICGRQAIDGDTAQVGPQIAEFLNIPQVTFVRKVEKISGSRIIVQRALEDGYERISAPFPVLVTVVGNINKPRYPRMDLLFRACEDNAGIHNWNAADLGLSTQEIGLAGSLTRVIRTFSPKIRRKNEMVKGTKENIVERFVQNLTEEHLL
jgi:electron transfer flavoprotein alpha/beta subunit